jgi:hypothetical protein
MESVGDRALLMRISKLEHDLGQQMPCSDPECPECTGIHRTVDYDWPTKSYRLATRVGDTYVYDRVASEVFDRQLLMILRPLATFGSAT